MARDCALSGASVSWCSKGPVAGEEQRCDGVASLPWRVWWGLGTLWDSAVLTLSLLLQVQVAGWVWVVQ